ncbi:DUF192 domain-containing protein [Paracoccus luteus]|uniref:DUF192 domain-containing protein n=1 Tax=Paracoccus luteus TaxID=2508543 RepID=UPI00106F76DA|nr:DUF192 domain-containing protein [Paracoccus luteus]
MQMTCFSRMRANAAAAALALAAAGPAAAATVCAPGTATILPPTGDTPLAQIAVEIADTPQARAQGLMGREALPQGQGMLFVYETPQPTAFWMKNTLIPLDMLFFDATGVLRRIHAKARPHDLTPIFGAAADDPDPDRLLVLELAGGEAARLALTPGARLAHPSVPQQGAVAPCR